MNIRAFVQNFDHKYYVLINERLKYHVSAKPFTFVRELYIKDAETEETLVTITRARNTFYTNYILIFADGSLGELTTLRLNRDFRLDYNDNVFIISGSLNPFKSSFVVKRNDKQVGSSNKISNSLFNNDFYNLTVDDNIEQLPTIALVATYKDITTRNS